MGVYLGHLALDTSACAHGRPLLHVMGECLFCGHCGADVPDHLHHASIRCDGAVVAINQDDFGEIHRCDRPAAQESVETWLDLTASV